MKKSTAWIQVCLIAGVALLGSARAHADSVVFANGTPSHDNGLESSDGGDISGTFVRFSSSLSFNGIQWWGGFAAGTTPGSGDVFRLSIANDSGLIPVNVGTFSLGTASPALTGQNVSTGFPEYLYTAGLGTTLNLAGGKYAFTLEDLNTQTLWYWETSIGGSGLGGQSYNGFEAVAFPNDLAFQLTAPVPLPNAGWLILSGLGPLRFLARRRISV